MSARSPLSVVFLLHIALEAPLAISAFWSPASLPFLQMTNTTLVLLKLYTAFTAATCVTTFLVHPLPEFLPGKRALAIGLCIYHSVASTVLFQAPRFIPHSFGPLFESCVALTFFFPTFRSLGWRRMCSPTSCRLKVTPEVAWGTMHGLLGLAMVVWWQGTLGYVSMAKKAA
ncbi:hypothetical protein EDD17DRAFT_628836 [Pisolithus thermaeus]|nr:hypothetical protein EDD17DRAFT_628836 [Pisolithus thermaeus]